jgi:hypothetical protein
MRLLEKIPEQMVKILVMARRGDYGLLAPHRQDDQFSIVTHGVIPPFFSIGAGNRMILCAKGSHVPLKENNPSIPSFSSHDR